MNPLLDIYSEPLFSVSQCPPSSSSSSLNASLSGTRAEGNHLSQHEDIDEDCEEEPGSSQDSEESVFDLSKLTVRASEIHQDYLTTGCPLLDKELKGGIPAFGITELYGEGGSGKTQLCLQLAITAQLGRNDGGLGADVLYVCTEDVFPSKRLNELIIHMKQKFPDALPDVPSDHIFVEHVADPDTLMECLVVKLEALARMSTRKVRLVVLDSVAGIFRSEMDDFNRRTMGLRELAHSLHEFSHNHKAAIIVCNQVTASLQCGGNIAALGMTWKNMVTTRIRMSKAESHQHRHLEACFSPHIPSARIPFLISSEGLQVIPEFLRISISLFSSTKRERKGTSNGIFYLRLDFTMKVDCSVLTCLHLDPGYALLSVQNCLTCMEVFNLLDIHRNSKINDVQCMLLLKNITNLNTKECEEIFTMLDYDHSGEIEFEEFYLFFCILIANKDSVEKEFIYRHSATIFQLIDIDSSGEINALEFSRMGIFFNFDKYAIRRIFKEFDKNLDFSEFRLFTMACIDEARAQETREKVKAFSRYRERLLTAMEPLLRRFIRTDRLPRPREVEDIVNHVRHPYIPGRKDLRRHFRYHVIRQSFHETRLEIVDYFREKLSNVPCIFCICGYLLCCYCCTEDPLLATGRTCACKCKCRCMRCWLTFLRKLWTCCFCIFPCCHCCEPPEDQRQHVARPEKVKWPDPALYDEEIRKKYEDPENAELANANEQLTSSKSTLNLRPLLE